MLEQPNAYCFRQTVWANIWNAVLAVNWPFPNGIPLAEKGPVPEVVLSRLPNKGWILPHLLNFVNVHAGFVGIFFAREWAKSSRKRSKTAGS